LKSKCNRRREMGSLADENSDQSKFSRGIRDIDNKRDDGKFIEVEQNPTDRRDPEESRHDEAGFPIFTQGDEEMNDLSKKNKNPEGSKISSSEPQESL
jgi:hypothetical protein